MTAAGVLVVEDDPDIRAVIVLCLQDAGYTVHEAPHGTAALELLHTHSEGLVVLLDLVMPEMDGPTFLHAVAEDSSLLTKHAYVIVTAAKIIPSSDAEAIAKHFNVPFIYKPFDLDHLLATVQKSVSTL